MVGVPTPATAARLTRSQPDYYGGLSRNPYETQRAQTVNRAAKSGQPAPAYLDPGNLGGPSIYDPNPTYYGNIGPRPVGGFGPRPDVVAGPPGPSPQPVTGYPGRAPPAYQPLPRPNPGYPVAPAAPVAPLPRPNPGYPVAPAPVPQARPTAPLPRTPNPRSALAGPKSRPTAPKPRTPNPRSALAGPKARPTAPKPRARPEPDIRDYNAWLRFQVAQGELSPREAEQMRKARHQAETGNRRYGGEFGYGGAPAYSSMDAPLVRQMADRDMRDPVNRQRLYEQKMDSGLYTPEQAADHVYGQMARQGVTGGGGGSYGTSPPSGSIGGAVGYGGYRSGTGSPSLNR